MILLAATRFYRRASETMTEALERISKDFEDFAGFR